MNMNDDKQLNKRITVTISEDNMSAYIRLNALAIGDYDYTIDEVNASIAEVGVKMGIKKEVLHDILSEKKFDMDILFAEGKVSEDGVDGKYNLFFDSSNNGKPTLKEDGSVDYYNLKLFEVVTEGQKLVEYVPPTKGVFGFNVRGKLLVPRPGKPKLPLRGKGFTTSEDGNTYFAAIDGKVEYRNADLNVYNVLEISGDVDLNVGNIDFNGDVEIKGNVISGLVIHAKGSITIGGHVEGAVIKSEKDIVFRDGVNGKGVARVEAKGNVHANFLENTLVVCEGNLNANYILNCNVICNGQVNVQGKIGTIQGGDVAGVLGVIVGGVGNDSGVMTVIRVGATKELKQKYTDLMARIKEINSEIDMYNLLLDKYERLKAVSSDRYDRAKHQKLLQTKIIKNSELSKCDADSKAALYLMQEAEKARVIVDKNLHPGAKLFVDGFVYEPHDIVAHLIIKKGKDKVAVEGIWD